MPNFCETQTYAAAESRVRKPSDPYTSQTTAVTSPTRNQHTEASQQGCLFRHPSVPTAPLHPLASKPHLPLNDRPRMQHRLHIRSARNYSRPRPPARNRVLYAGLTLAVIGVGLLWRSSFMPLPPMVSKYGGDALWALMVFVGFGFLIPRASTTAIALMALTFIASYLSKLVY